jgi:hypothetical protein
MAQYQIVLGMVAAVSALGLSSTAHAWTAQDVEAMAAFQARDKDYFTIDSVEVKEITDAQPTGIAGLRDSFSRRFDDPCRDPRTIDPEDPRCDDRSRRGNDDPRDDGNSNPGPRDRGNPPADDSTTTRRGGGGDYYDNGRGGSSDRDDSASTRRREDDTDWTSRTSTRRSATDGLVVIDDIINTVMKIWKIVNDNKPVANTKMDFANAVPKGIKNWDELDGWSMPTARLFQVAYKNKLGSTVVDFTYRVRYTHGGNYRGVGQYLTNITFEPASLRVSWGFKFTATGRVPNVTNAGTKEAPIAQAEMLLDWKINSMMVHQEDTVVYVVRGDGRLHDISRGN